MAQIKVDGQLVEVPDYFTLMQAAEAAGAEIPRFCYHERMNPVGKCRMCLVECDTGRGPAVTQRERPPAAVRRRAAEVYPHRERSHISHVAEWLQAGG